MEYKNCCRLCLSDDADTLKSVFDDAVKEKATRERILAFLSVDIKENDKLSTLVCTPCTSKVNSWSEFRRSCFKNQTILENLAGKSDEIHDMSVHVKEEVFDNEVSSDEGDEDIEITYSAVPVKSEPEDVIEEELEEEEEEEGEDVSEYLEQEQRHNENGNQEKSKGDIKAELNSTSSSDQNDGKIAFAAGLRLIKADTTPITMENLSPLETSYIEKCKAMVVMYRTLICACHNQPHPNVKGLLSHLRSVKIWFPVFTCYHCMITFTDRSSSGRHLHKCPNKNLETLVKLSNLKKRSSLKIRIYQNYRCVKCRFLFTFHEDFCKHVDEEHCNHDEDSVVTISNCSCGKTFESVEDYKDHVYVSCLVEYYCDICGASVKTLKEFMNHAENNHDRSEGFALLQDDNYRRRSIVKVEPRENKEILGKRRSSTYGRSVDEDSGNNSAVEAIESDPILISPAVKKFKGSTNSRNTPTKCLKCDKVYSCYANMMRHYRKHSEVPTQQLETTQQARVNSLYRCPDCHSVFNAHDWKNHRATHIPQNCDECGKQFVFKSELDAHRSVHLNLKVYRDAKTHSYKSTTMLSATSDAPVCDICNIVCENFEDLESHKLSHEELDIDDDDDEEMNHEAMGNSASSAKYSCIPCNKHYTGYSGLWDHNKKKHSDKQTTNFSYPRQCDECEKVISSGSAFASHKAMHRRVRDETVRISTNSPLVAAPATSPSPTPPSPKLKPKKPVPDEDYFTCKRCFKVFSTKYNLKKHMILHGITPKSKKVSLTCEECNIAFNNSAEHKAHFDEEHNGNIKEEDPADEDLAMMAALEDKPYIFTCDICVQTFNTKNALKLHKEQHAIESVVKTRNIVAATCKHCKIAFMSLERYTEHMENEHDEKPTKSNTKPAQTANSKGGFACKICKKTFLSQPAMYAHQGWHKRTKHENGKLNEPSPIKFVVNEAKNAKKLACSKCRLELPNDTALQIHILEKHGNITTLLAPKCEPCNQEFATQSEYENHRKLHEIVENQKKVAAAQFPCNFCGSVFSKNETLQAHIRLNHREVYAATELKCQQCNRVFDKLISLNNHMKVHEKQKMVASTPKPLYFCSICNMGFNVPKELRNHTISTHPF